MNLFSETKLYRIMKISDVASYDSIESLYDNSEFGSQIKQINQYRRLPKRPKLVATCFCTRKIGLDKFKFKKKKQFL